MKDMINPDHYKVGGIETIDVIKAKLGGRKKPHQEGLVCVQLDVKWVKHNTCIYKRLMGNV